MKPLLPLALLSSILLPAQANAGLIDSFIGGVLYDLSNEYNPRRYTREFKGDLVEYRRNGTTYRIGSRGTDACYC